MRDISNIIKYMQKTDNGFYSPEHIISYKRPANIITGHRSGGKSTGVARFNLFDAILNNSRFIYMRRTKDELDKTKIHFFDQAIDIINRSELGFKIIYFDCIAGDYMCTVIKDGEPDLNEDQAKERAVKVGSTMALSLSQKVKSGYDFANVNNIIYDEFIAEHQTGYLGSYENPDVEYTNLISVYVSCDRGIDKYFRNETRIFLIGNMANIYNPILLKWGVNRFLRMSPDARIIAPKGMAWALENVEPSEKFKEQAQSSFAYALMDQSERDYNMGNKPRSEEYSKDFIRKDIPGNAYYREGVVLGGKEYGIYSDPNSYIYIGKFNRNFKAEALDIVSYANGNTNILVTNWRQSPILNVVYLAFLRKKLFFNNVTTQHEFMQYLEFIPR